MNGDSVAPRVRRWYERYLPFAVRQPRSDQSVARAWENPHDLAALTDAELHAFENRGVPSIDRASDSAEARADEKQDVTSSLNFPLHWTTPEQSWNYLFDFQPPASFLRLGLMTSCLTSLPALAGHPNSSAAWVYGRSRSICRWR